MTLTPELLQWRKNLRSELLARRRAVAQADHARWSAAIEATLAQTLPVGPGWVVGLCWPYQAEFDARPLAGRLRALGARLALPVVVAKARPLEFREWWPDAPLKADVYGLPVPDGTPVLVPDVLLVPPVGIGAQGDRLGYGGGFFDRTLAAIDPPPLAVAHAFEVSRIDTTHPQPHDILMDLVVTERGVQKRGAGGLEDIDCDEARRHLCALAEARGLPRRRNANG